MQTSENRTPPSSVGTLMSVFVDLKTKNNKTKNKTNKTSPHFSTDFYGKADWYRLAQS